MRIEVHATLAARDMDFDDLFDALDLGSDDVLSREELHRAARVLDWHWREAPVYAVLDLLTVVEPLTRSAFRSGMAEILADPLGAYGQVLRRSPLVTSAESITTRNGTPAARATTDEPRQSVVAVLEQVVGAGAADHYRALVADLDDSVVDCGRSALLIIDPQRSFTRGAWMRSVGADADREVEPIRRAFAECGRVLRRRYGTLATMFTRCPFPPESYEWDDGVGSVVDTTQLYFVKPGNSVMWPPTNGFREWLAALVHAGKNTLVIGGCTLNSCVRVSSIDAAHHVAGTELRVMVDLSLCGARAGNYVRSPEFGGKSSVESAVSQMVGEGVSVVERVAWRD